MHELSWTLQDGGGVQGRPARYTELLWSRDKQGLDWTEAYRVLVGLIKVSA